MNPSNFYGWCIASFLLFSTDFSRAAESLIDIKSQAFNSVVNYAFAKAVCFSISANSWSPLAGTNSYILTQKLREKTGATVTVNIYINPQEDGRQIINVEYPDFKVNRYTFVVELAYADGRFWVGEDINAAFVNGANETVFRNVPLKLPDRCDATIKSEFRLSLQESKQLKEMSRSAFAEAYSNEFKEGLVFVRPFSPRFDQYVSLYWVEGKKVIRMEFSRHEREAVRWNELFDFKSFVPTKRLVDTANFQLRLQHEIATHVENGLLLNISSASASK